MSTNVLSWIEQIFVSKVSELEGKASEEALALLREANTDACARLQSHPRVFLKVKPELRYWVERHAEVAVLLAHKVSGAPEILPGHYADAVSAVSAWKPGVNGSLAEPSTPWCPRTIDLYGRLSQKRAA